VSIVRKLVIPILAASALLATAVPSAMAATSPARASNRFAAAATPFQNKVIDRVMASHPGGTRVSASEVEWDNGRIGFGVTRAHHASAKPDTTYSCSTGYFCAWGEAGYQGGCFMYVAGGVQVEFDWAAYSGDACGSVGTWSWQNETAYRVWKEQDWSGETPISGATYFYSGGTDSGNSYCIKPEVSNSDVTAASSREDGWIQMTSNTATC
jgi:hypothetical protein